MRRCLCRPLSSASGRTPLLVHDSPKMEDIVSLCKRRGFIYPSSEIYNSISGFFDYGHLGVELKNNLKRHWWKENVYKRSDIVGLDSSIISSPLVWKASGHIDGFSDPLLDCKESNIRIRADHAFWAKVETVSKQHVGYICLMEGQGPRAAAGPVTPEGAMKAAKSLAKKLSITEPLSQPILLDMTQVPAEVLPLLPSPITGTVGVLTPPRDFNLMFRTSVGAVSNDEGVAYLRPETAQGIFTNFLNVQRSSRLKVQDCRSLVGSSSALTDPFWSRSNRQSFSQ
jgi:glycyl-tRNA synthetase